MSSPLLSLLPIPPLSLHCCSFPSNIKSDHIGYSLRNFPLTFLNFFLFSSSPLPQLSASLKLLVDQFLPEELAHEGSFSLVAYVRPPSFPFVWSPLSRLLMFRRCTADCLSAPCFSVCTPAYIKSFTCSDMIGMIIYLLPLSVYTLPLGARPISLI